LVAMIALTSYSQFAIIPAMERDRIAAGGTIDAADAATPAASTSTGCTNAPSMWKKPFC